MSQYLSSPPAATEDASDALNPFSFISNSVGIPTFLMTMLYPQVMELAKRYPRFWKILSGMVALQLTYAYTQAKLKTLLGYVISLSASSIKVYEGDELLGCFFRWLDKQHPPLTHRQVVTAQSVQYKNTTRSIDSQEDLTTTPEEVQPNNFTLQRKYRVRVFRYNGRFFWLSHASTIPRNTMGRDGQPVTNSKSALTIWTLGGSIKPIAAILEEAVENHSNDGEKSATTLYIPTSGNGGHWEYEAGIAGIWKKHAVKPCRPLDTVYLDGVQRESIQRDVSCFLHPDTATRYRSKGIPHRRGYMFHGPPGNGKSSLAMALAGHFGLNVYSLSLRDANMNDSFLGQLFNVLPSSKVLVLLEDIDSAGLKREEEFDDDNSNDDDNDVLWADPELIPAPTRRRRLPRPRVTNVTLSGVLNALDGISAPEGHIVVMTTNAPDSLDKALIRPGRIDLKVEFKNASPKQLYDIFHRMYRDEKNVGAHVTPHIGSASSSPVLSSIASDIDDDDDDDDEKPRQPVNAVSPYGVLVPLAVHEPLSPQQLHRLASKFSLSIPAGQHSLASIQNYLLGRVDEPHRAVEEASAWAEEEKREKEEAQRRKLKKQADRERLKQKKQKEMFEKLKRLPSDINGQAAPLGQVSHHDQVQGKVVGHGDGQAANVEVVVNGVNDAEGAANQASDVSSANSASDGGTDSAQGAGKERSFGSGKFEQVVVDADSVKDVGLET